MPVFGGKNTGFGGIAGQLAVGLAGNIANRFFPTNTNTGISWNDQPATVDSISSNRRISLGPKPGAVDLLLGPTGGNLLDPLRNTNNSMIWPYTPTISYSQEVSYSAYEMMHVIQEFLTYQRTPAPKFTIDGTFTVQNQEEGRYVLACIHFLRTMSKMYFGSADTKVSRGTPPPILELNGYGEFMFNKLPVVLTGFNFTLNNDVDYVLVDAYTSKTTTIDNRIEIQPMPPVGKPKINYNVKEFPRVVGKQDTFNNVEAGSVWLPSALTISASLTVQNIPKTLREFNLDKFRTGESLKTSGGFF